MDLRVVQRAGRPLLILPAGSKCAVQALNLYPAQTAKARAAKFLLGLALRAGQAPRLANISITVAPDEPFIRFLAATARLPEGEVPTFAMLAGNPKAEGRRFVILLFDTNREPIAIVKVGTTVPARRLIAHEAAFLQSVPAQIIGVPKLRGTFVSAQLDAFATDYVAGHSPSLNDVAPLATLLTSWLTLGRLMAMTELGAWQRLQQASTSTPLPEAVQSLGALHFHAPLMHGDFAPWNVKVCHARWLLVDWERGELAGVPTWDWLHFIIQSAVLVRRETGPQLLARLEGLLVAEDFQDYACRAGVNGRERALALGYLCYCTRVLRQTEGGEQIADLEAAARQRWFP